jgi:hypothetical protein
MSVRRGDSHPCTKEITSSSNSRYSFALMVNAMKLNPIKESTLIIKAMVNCCFNFMITYFHLLKLFHLEISILSYLLHCMVGVIASSPANLIRGTYWAQNFLLYHTTLFVIVTSTSGYYKISCRTFQGAAGTYLTHTIQHAKRKKTLCRLGTRFFVFYMRLALSGSEVKVCPVAESVRFSSNWNDGTASICLNFFRNAVSAIFASSLASGAPRQK